MVKYKSNPDPQLLGVLGNAAFIFLASAEQKGVFERGWNGESMPTFCDMHYRLHSIQEKLKMPKITTEGGGNKMAEQEDLELTSSHGQTKTTAVSE